MSRRFEGLYKKAFEAAKRVPFEKRVASRRGVLTPEEVNALKSGQHHLRSYAPKIQSQIQMMQEMMYQGILNRRAGNDH